MFPLSCFRKTLVLIALLLVTNRMAHGEELECNDYAVCRDWEARAQTFYAQGNYKSALAAYWRAHDVVSDPALVINIARIYQRLGDFDSARKHCLAARQAAPGNPRVQIKSSELLAELDALALPANRPRVKATAEGNAQAAVESANVNSAPVSQETSINIIMPGQQFPTPFPDTVAAGESGMSGALEAVPQLPSERRQSGAWWGWKVVAPIAVSAALALAVGITAWVVEDRMRLPAGLQNGQF